MITAVEARLKSEWIMFHGTKNLVQFQVNIPDSIPAFASWKQRKALE